MTITNPAPKAFALVTVTTDSGDLTMPCEPINEWLAITPSFGMDEDGNSHLHGAFTVMHRPTGRNVVEGEGCIECCRSAGKALAALDADWSTLTPANSVEWSAALSDDTKVAFTAARSVGWLCDAKDCEPWKPFATIDTRGLR